MIKVLYDNQIYQSHKFGGVKRYFDELLKINSPNIKVELIHTLKEKTVIHKNQDLFSRGFRYLKRILSNQKSNQDVISYINRFKDETFDVFHPTYYDPYFLKFTKKPFVLTVHDMIHEIFFEYFDPSDPTSHNKRILCEKADKIITVSETTKNDLIAIFKLPKDKVHAIPLASNFDKIIPQKPTGEENLENYILFVGSRRLYKNFYFSVIALSDLLKNDKKLLLVCTGQAFSKEEVEFFRTLKIEHQVKHIYLQNDNELAWAYQHARVFIFPSLYEGFGFPMLEAFASNCPVILSTGGSLVEVGGDAALYFDPKNSLEIQQAAYTALYNPEIRSELILKGQNQLKKFDWNTCRMQTIEVYKSVYNNHKRLS